MKILRISSATLLVLLSIVFFACQKDLKSPSVASDAKGGGVGTPPPPAFVFTVPTFGTACVTDESYCFDASFTNKGGNDPGGNNSITVTISQNGLPVDGQNQQYVEATTGHFCFSGLAAGQYSILVYFRHAGSDNAQPVNVPLSFTLTVQSAEQCGGTTSECTADNISLTRSANLTYVETDIKGSVVNVSSAYTVHSCGVDFKNLKLQGGLVNKATLLSDPTPASGAASTTGDATNIKYKASTSNGNTVLTWIFDLPANGTQTFTVYYKVWGVTCGSGALTDPIGALSGAWSLKNSAGTPIGVSQADMSATQTGYLDRLYWVCP